MYFSQVRSELIRSDRFCWNFGANVDSATITVEVNLAVHQREKRVVTAHADVLTGMPLGSTLANDDVACDDRLAAKLLNTQTLRIGIATVAAGTLSLLMSHVALPFIEKYQAGDIASGRRSILESAAV